MASSNQVLRRKTYGPDLQDFTELEKVGAVAPVGGGATATVSRFEALIKTSFSYLVYDDIYFVRLNP
jgi:hypothetical protein